LSKGNKKQACPLGRDRDGRLRSGLAGDLENGKARLHSRDRAVSRRARPEPTAKRVKNRSDGRFAIPPTEWNRRPPCDWNPSAPARGLHGFPPLVPEFERECGPGRIHMRGGPDVFQPAPSQCETVLCVTGPEAARRTVSVTGLKRGCSRRLGALEQHRAAVDAYRETGHIHRPVRRLAGVDPLDGVTRKAKGIPYYLR